MAAPGALPNLGALRLGASAPETDTGVGQPQTIPDAQRLGEGRDGNGDAYLNYGRSDTWIPAVAQLSLDRPVALNEYDRMVESLTNTARVELGEVPKYIFIIDGENTMGIPVRTNARLREMFANVRSLEVKDHAIMQNVESAGQQLEAPVQREPTALFICVSKNANNRPNGKRADVWYQSAFSMKMREIAAEFCWHLGGPQLAPRAVAYQLHVHVPRCRDGATAPLDEIARRGRAPDVQPYPCQDLKTRDDPVAGRQSVCFNYHHETRVTAPDHMYEHGYCEFDDILTGRLYESALRLLSKWNREARADLNQRALARGLTTASQQGHTSPHDYYSTLTWSVARETIRSALNNGDFAPPPTPFLLSRDRGMRYREMHQRGGRFDNMHVNWEWVLFGPRTSACVPELWQGFARRDWNSILGFLDELNAAMQQDNSPNPIQVDNSLLPFSKQGLTLVAYPALLSRPGANAGPGHGFSSVYP